MPGDSRQQFERTHWSLVMRRDRRGYRRSRAGRALPALLVSDLRVSALRRPWPGECAKITRSFRHLFRHFMMANIARPGPVPPVPAARLRAFLENEQPIAAVAEVGAELIEPPPDLELKYQRDNGGAQSPEQAYQQGFALELLARAGDRLREEAGQTGRLDMFDALQPFLAIDLPPAEADELGKRFGTRSVVVAVALRRLRQRFRELIDAELADTVASADELVANSTRCSPSCVNAADAMNDTVRAAVSPLRKENSVLPRGGNVRLADLAFGSLSLRAQEVLTTDGIDRGRHLAFLPTDALEIDLGDVAQRQFGDYELLEQIGEGGMGVVYRARQISLDREMAVKLLSAGPWASRDFVERFQREAQNAAFCRIEHRRDSRSAPSTRCILQHAPDPRIEPGAKIREGRG